jgi:hypothetical protein
MIRIDKTEAKKEKFTLIYDKITCFLHYFDKIVVFL